MKKWMSLIPIASATKRLELRIKYGATHCEIFLTNHGPVLVEMGARLMGRLPGACENNKIFKHSSLQLLLHMYKDTDVWRRYKSSADKGIYRPLRLLAYKSLINRTPGTISKITGNHYLPLISNILEVHLSNYISVGQKLDITKDLVKIPGYIVFTGMNTNDLINTYILLQFIEQYYRGYIYKFNDEQKLMPINLLCKTKRFLDYRKKHFSNLSATFSFNKEKDT